MKFVTPLLIGAFVIGGVSVSAYAMTNTQAVSSNTTQMTISKINAKEIALEASNGGKVTDIEVKEEAGIKKYEVEIVNQNREYEVDIDGSTGKVLEITNEVLDENDEDDSEGNIVSGSPKISAEQAKNAALNKLNGTVKEQELNNDDNRLVYEFEINTVDHREGEVKVDAVSGKVISVELED